MSAEIIVSWDHSEDTSFPVGSGVFELVCKKIAEAATRPRNTEVYQLCQDALDDRRLLLVYASVEAQRFFGEELRKALNNGSIIDELLSWPVPNLETSMLLPAHKKPEVISFICNHAAVNTLRRLSQYLLENKTAEGSSTS